MSHIEGEERSQAELGCGFCIVFQMFHLVASQPIA
jgi:hypothetical protein